MGLPVSLHPSRCVVESPSDVRALRRYEKKFPKVQVRGKC
jgi:hypothetical protein